MLRTNPQPTDTGAAVLALLGDVPNRAVIACIRDGGLPRVDANNLQPHRFRAWVYAHDGETPESAGVRQDLLDAIPQFIRGNIKGTQASEILFHHLLGSLHRDDALELKPFDPGAAAAAIAAAVGKIQHEGALASYSAILAGERDTFAVRLGPPMWYRAIHGLEVIEEEPMFAGHRPKTTQHPSFRAVMMVNGDRPGEDWLEVPDRSVAYIGADWELACQPVE